MIETGSCPPPRSAYIRGMNTIHVTDEELKVARDALRAYLRAFGHDEAEVAAGIRRVVAKFDAAEAEDTPRSA